MKIQKILLKGFSNLPLNSVIILQWMPNWLFQRKGTDSVAMEKFLLAYIKKSNLYTNNKCCKKVEIARQSLIEMKAIKVFERLYLKVLEFKVSSSLDMYNSPNLPYFRIKEHFVFKSLVELGAIEVFEKMILKRKHVALAASGIIAIEKKGARVINGITVFEHLAGALEIVTTVYGIKQIEAQWETCSVTGYGGLASYDESIKVTKRLYGKLLDLIPDPKNKSNKSSSEIFKYLNELEKKQEPEIVISKEEYTGGVRSV